MLDGAVLTTGIHALQNQQYLMLALRMQDILPDIDLMRQLSEQAGITFFIASAGRLILRLKLL